MGYFSTPLHTTGELNLPKLSKLASWCVHGTSRPLASSLLLLARLLSCSRAHATRGFLWPSHAHRGGGKKRGSKTTGAVAIPVACRRGCLLSRCDGVAQYDMMMPVCLVLLGAAGCCCWCLNLVNKYVWNLERGEKIKKGGVFF